MKILFIIDPVVPISNYYSVGSTNAAVQLCKSLHDKGLEVVLGAYWDKDVPELMEYVTPLNIKPVPTRCYMQKAFEIINEHLKTNKYDSISVHISTPSASKYLRGLENGDTPVYFTMHSWTGTSAVTFHYREDFESLINTDKVKFVFLCESQKDTLFNELKLTPKNYIVEPNAVLGESYDIDGREAHKFVESKLPEHYKYTGYNLVVARLVRSKHILDIIEATKLRDQPLVIIGKEWINDLDYSNKIKEMVNAEPDRLFWIDELPNQDVLKFMKMANCTILLTDMEVCNLTIIESCLVGTPVVTGPYATGLKDSIDNLKAGGIEVIEFPFRSRYEKKLDIISQCIERAKYYRYDTSKFPECYRWDKHVDNYYKIVTNQADFK